jgi:hypothetical protein
MYIDDITNSNIKTIYIPADNILVDVLSKALNLEAFDQFINIVTLITYCFKLLYKTKFYYRPST